MNKPLHVRCPRCNKPVSWGPDSLYKPFCSNQCKLIDLGKWANDEHAIPGESVDITHLDHDTLDS